LAGILSTTALAANGSFTASFEKVVYSDNSSMATYYVVLASSDQPGTVYVDQSTDGVNVSRSDSLATAADAGPQGGQSAMLKVAVLLQFVRARYVNGATAQGRFLLASRFTQS
jgi:hypothetical protein